MSVISRAFPSLRNSSSTCQRLMLASVQSSTRCSRWPIPRFALLCVSLALVSYAAVVFISVVFTSVVFTSNRRKPLQACALRAYGAGVLWPRRRISTKAIHSLCLSVCATQPHSQGRLKHPCKLEPKPTTLSLMDSSRTSLASLSRLRHAARAATPVQTRDGI